MLASSPAWLSAATSTLAYGVRKAGWPAVVARSFDSQVTRGLAALLGEPPGALGARRRARRVVLPRHHRDVRQQRGVDVPGQRGHLAAQVAPAPSSVDRRPPGVTALASQDVAQRLRAGALLRSVDERPDPAPPAVAAAAGWRCRPASTAGKYGRPRYTRHAAPGLHLERDRRRTRCRTSRRGRTPTSARSRRCLPFAVTSGMPAGCMRYG